MFLGQYVGVRSATFWVITPLMGKRQTRFRKPQQLRARPAPFAFSTWSTLCRI